MATNKQLKAIDNLIENHGNVSKSMREAGYSEVTAKNPKNLTNSKAFQELMSKAITDEKLIKVINEGLEANRVVGAIDGGATIETPDHAIRHKFLETSLKIKGYGKDTDDKGNTFNFINGNASFNAGNYKK